MYLSSLSVELSRNETSSSVASLACCKHWTFSLKRHQFWKSVLRDVTKGTHKEEHPQSSVRSALQDRTVATLASSPSKYGTMRHQSIRVWDKKKQIGPKDQTSSLYSCHLIYMILLFIDRLYLLFANSLLSVILQTQALAHTDRTFWLWHMGKKKHLWKSNLKSLLGLYRTFWNICKVALFHIQERLLWVISIFRGNHGTWKRKCDKRGCLGIGNWTPDDCRNIFWPPRRRLCPSKEDTWVEKRCLLLQRLIEGKQGV